MHSNVDTGGRRCRVEDIGDGEDEGEMDGAREDGGTISDRETNKLSLGAEGPQQRS